LHIEIGKYAGFCRGVKNAVNKTFDCARQSKGEIYTDGELIHNPQTLKMLESRQVHILKDNELEKARGKTLIIRAHGITPDRLIKLRSITETLKNFTCRDVGKVQGTIKKWSNKGYSIVIYGKKNHPEVIGLLGYANEGYVVFNSQDIDNLPKMGKVLLVSQTTMSQENFSAIYRLMIEKYPQMQIVNTICDATEKRQNEVLEMARRKDCLLIIGGKKSSNSKRLYEIAEKFTKAYFVETIEEIKKINFDGVKNLGVSAGASTPDWLIDEVVEEIQRQTQTPLIRFLKNLLFFSLYSNLFVALGAFVLSFAVADNLGVGFSLDISILVLFYYLSMSLMNTYTNRLSFKIDNFRSYNFIKRFKYIFSGLFVATFSGIIILAIHMSTEILALTLFSLLLGIAYNLSYLPLRAGSEKLLFFRKRNLLALKSLVLSFAVTVLLNGLTLLKHYPSPWINLTESREVLTGLGFYFSIYYVFLLMFTRQVLFEMKTVQSDRIGGVSSLINIMSRKTIIRLLFLLPTLLLCAMLIGVFLGTYPVGKIKYFFAVIYNYILVWLSVSKRMFHNRMLFELIVESNLYVAGLISLF
jgi:4-hydroxy-3-methylbut-2-enyl diphosphate reductase